MKRILKLVTYIAAGLYLLVDVIFMTLAKPIANWIDRHVRLRRLRAWIRSLAPYPSLALFSVPVIVLEPIKPIAAYLAATGQFVGGALTFIFGELLKLVLVEPIQPYTRKADEDSRLCQTIWMVQPGHRSVKSDGGLAQVRIACEKRSQIF